MRLYSLKFIILPIIISKICKKDIIRADYSLKFVPLEVMPPITDMGTVIAADDDSHIFSYSPPAYSFILHFGFSCGFSVPSSGWEMPSVIPLALLAFISSLMLMVLGMACSTGGFRSAACSI